MTLVSLIVAPGSPTFLISDILVSSTLPETALIPTISRDSAYLQIGDSHFAVDVTQKIVLIRPWLCLGWAGLLHKSRNLILLLDKILPTYIDNPQQIDRILKSQINRDATDGLELLLCYIYQGNVFFYEKMTTKDFGHYGKLYCIGKGVGDFLSVLDTMSNENNIVRGDMPVGMKALSFAATSFFAQKFNGFGLENLWGGGMDIVLAGHDRFTRPESVLIRSFQYDYATDELFRNQFFTLQFTVNDDPCFIWPVDEENIEILAVLPPHRMSEAVGVFDINRHINIMIDIGFGGDPRAIFHAISVFDITDHLSDAPDFVLNSSGISYCVPEGIDRARMQAMQSSLREQMKALRS